MSSLVHVYEHANMRMFTPQAQDMPPSAPGTESDSLVFGRRGEARKQLDTDRQTVQAFPSFLHLWHKF